MQTKMQALAICVLSIIHSSYSTDAADCGPHAIAKADHFSYAVKNKWNTMFVPACDGSSQSPINIIFDEAKTQAFKTPLNLGGYKVKLVTEHLENNGHTAVLSNNIKIQITGGPANDDIFELKQFHFHFGKKNNLGSEHQFNGNKFPMEIHFVHMNTKYDSLDTATQNKDGLLVIGVFAVLNKGKPANAVLDSIAKALGAVDKAEESTDIDEAMNLSGLFPDNGAITSYFTYNGSLTTPRCYEAVIWVMAKRKIIVNQKQLKAFRTLKDDCGKLIAGNFRNVQKLNGRTVHYVST